MEFVVCIVHPRGESTWSTDCFSWVVENIEAANLTLNEKKGKMVRGEMHVYKRDWLHLIALWGWFCCNVLPVTCCEHGPPSIATVHFSKFSIATNILFNYIPFNQAKQVFRFSWQSFVCVPWQPFYSNSAITLATTMWATNFPFWSTKIQVSVSKMKKKINQWACYNRIWSWSPMPCEKTWPSGLSNDYWVPQAMFSTRHGRPWSNPTIYHLL